MKPSEVLRVRRGEVVAILARHGIRDAQVFGSVARDEDAEGSDLDLLVQFPPGTTLLDVSEVNLDLEELLGCPVDLVSVGGLKGPRAEHIRQTARRL